MADEYDIDPDDPEEMDDEELVEARNLMCKEMTIAFKLGWTREYPPEYGISEGDDYVDEDENTPEDDDNNSSEE
jgi:hypothetical protein